MEDKHKERMQEAVRLHNAGRVAEAMSHYDAVLPFAQKDAFVNFAAGSALAQLGQYGLSVTLLEKAVQFDPDNHEAWINLGLSYRTVGMVERGIECYDLARKLPMPRDSLAGLYGNLSGCYVNEGNPQQCLEYADAGLALKDMPQLHNHRALALLEMGRYKEGFEEYEHRFRLPEFTNRDYGAMKKWTGEPVENLVIHGEQGLGDEVLFLTMLLKAAPYAQRIMVECADRLVGLLKHSFRHDPTIEFYPSHTALTKAVGGWEGKDDTWAWTAMGSLPATLWPWERSVYLESSKRFPKGDKRRVGISWRGGTTKTHEYYRNGPLEDWKRLVALLKAQGDEVISLQYGPAAHMAQILDIPHDERNIADLDALTGMVQSCDLVITVCNTTVHLAGASGTNCLVLVPSKPAWRYGLEGDRSDFYDSVGYVRQAKGEDWSDVMARVMVHDEVRALKVAA